MTIYTPPARTSVDFELSLFTPDSTAPYTSALSVYTAPALNAVNFALSTYTQPTFQSTDFELTSPTERVPYQQEWEDQWVTWSARQYDFFVAKNGWTDETSSDAQEQQVGHYYDATQHMLTMPAIVGQSSLAADRAAVLRRCYRDSYAIYYNGAVNGFTNFTGGMRLDWEMFADATSKSTVELMHTNSSFANSPLSSTADPNGVTSDGGARENAYRIVADLNARALGFTGNASLSDWLDQALDHLDIWTVSQSSSYVRPFMVAITCKALIQAYEEYPSYANIADIPDAIAAAYNYIWEHCWVPYDESDPNSRAFTYTDRAVGNTDPVDLDPQPDLNGLIVPTMGWLFSVTNDAIWRARGDDVFVGTLTEYDEYGFWVRGPYFGASTGTALAGKKQFNQTYFWSNQYITYAESSVSSTQNITGTSFTNTNSFGSGTITQTAPDQEITGASFTNTNSFGSGTFTINYSSLPVGSRGLLGVGI